MLRAMCTGRGLWASVLIGAVVLVGCASAPGADDEDGLEGATPLQSELGLITDPVKFATSVRDEMALRAEMEAECMREQGFEYVAWIPPDMALVDPEAALPAIEYVSKYGYGISTRPDLYRQLSESPEDPNAAIQESLSPDQFVAYERALNGNEPSVDSEPRVLELGGCMRQVADALTPSNAAPAEAVDRYFQLIGTLEDQIANDQRVLAAVEEWRGCMAELGYSFETLSDPIDSVFDRWAELVPEPDPAIARPSDASVLPPEELALYADPQRLADLVAYELRVAQDDIGCQATYTEVERGVRTELELEFIRKNGDLLEVVQPSLR